MTSSWIGNFVIISAWLDENCRFFIGTTFLCQSYFLLLIPYVCIILGEGNYNEDTDDEIPQEEIQQYLSEVQSQRDELRQNLRQKFAELCANGR